jgi:hypothetical protein
VAEVFEALAEGLVDVVADDIEEAVRAARLADASRDLVGPGAKIDQGQMSHRVWMVDRPSSSGMADANIVAWA